MEKQKFEMLIHGFDTLQCAYFLESTKKKGIDFELLTREKEGIKKTKLKESKRISLGEYNFLLHPFGSSSGYPLIITNEDFNISNPNSELLLMKGRTRSLQLKQAHLGCVGTLAISSIFFFLLQPLSVLSRLRASVFEMGPS